jgi:chemotaxis protein methyltransferase CheR
MTLTANQSDIEVLEIQLLLEAVFASYGFDFRDYAYPSIARRVENIVHAEGLQTISELQGRLLRDPASMERFLLAVTVNVTSMFRDPGFYLALRNAVVPLLRERPFIRIWHVGCSTGEEAYSTAILLYEEGLYSRCRIYATDMNENVLASAKAGIFPLGALQEFTRNYLDAGGQREFSEYYTARYGRVIFRHTLAENIVFAQHNLVTDHSFNEFDLVLCRNVLIYFNNALIERVHRLLYASLAPAGIWGWATKSRSGSLPTATATRNSTVLAGCIARFDRRTDNQT